MLPSKGNRRRTGWSKGRLSRLFDPKRQISSRCRHSRQTERDLKVARALKTCTSALPKPHEPDRLLGFSKGFAVAIGTSASLSVVAAIAGMWLPRAATAPANAASIARPETQSVPAMRG